ncbi:MAG: DUF4367 domain-containing protein [Clostridiales bacterium]|nr:DUF4367 domain-containing protein [Clostridiales bacterium]
MKKNEILKTAFLQASEKEWAEQSEAPFEMSDSFKAKMNEIVSNTKAVNNEPATRKVRLNISYMKRLLVAAVVMSLFAAVSVVTVWGIDERYGFIMSDTLYGLKLENSIERSYGSQNTDSEEKALASSSDSESDHANEDTGSDTHAYSVSTDNGVSDVASDGDCQAQQSDSDLTGDSTDYEMKEESDVDGANPATASDRDSEYIAAKFAPVFSDDYIRTYMFENDDVFMLTYESKNATVEFSQRIFSIDEYIPETTNTTVFTEVKGDTTYTVVAKPDENITILWSKHGYSFMMSSSQINYKDLIEIAETLTVFQE